MFISISCKSKAHQFLSKADPPFNEIISNSHFQGGLICSKTSVQNFLCHFSYSHCFLCLMEVLIYGPRLSAKIIPSFTCNFFHSHTESYYVKWNYVIFNGSYGATTYPCLPNKMIDPLDPPGLPQGIT